MQALSVGSQVTFRYCVGSGGAAPHRAFAGLTVVGQGEIVGETIVGSSDAYIIKPADGSACVHVRRSGVTLSS